MPPPAVRFGRRAAVVASALIRRQSCSGEPVSQTTALSALSVAPGVGAVGRKRRRFSSARMAPPPSPITSRSRFASSAIAADSSARKPGFAVAGENRGDRTAGSRFDHVVGVDPIPTEPPREPLGDRRLSGATITDQKHAHRRFIRQERQETADVSERRKIRQRTV